MAHIRPTLIALSLLLALITLADHRIAGAGAPAAELMTAAAPAEPAIRIRTERHRDLAEWALERYEAAGLELPDLDISIHPHLDDCKGNNGLYRASGGRDEIHVCAPWPSRIERALLHELGHAWSNATLGEHQRSAFLELRGLDRWYGGPWELQGFEHAAEILMWGLSEEPFPVRSIADSDADTLTAAFRSLTGTDPLHVSAEPPAAVPNVSRQPLP